MDQLATKKIAEGKQHIADAEKSMKTSLFKRKPDLDSAASSYSQAGSCFKIAKDLNKAIESYQKAADCFSQNNSLFNSAKQLEQIGLIANEQKNYTLLFESFQKAAELMITSGTRDSASILLERGANMLKLVDPEKSLKLYQRALQIAEVEEKYHEMVSFYENAVSLALKIEKYPEAISLINDLFNVLDRVGSAEQITKYCLTVVLIHLSKDDWVSAKSYLDKLCSKYEANSNFFTRVDSLLQAYDEKDDEKFKNLIKNYLTYAVDNEALKLAHKIIKSPEWLSEIRKPENISKPSPCYNTFQASVSNQENDIEQTEAEKPSNNENNPKSSDDVDDEFAEGLC